MHQRKGHRLRLPGPPLQSADNGQERDAAHVRSRKKTGRRDGFRNEMTLISKRIAGFRTSISLIALVNYAKLHQNYKVRHRVTCLLYTSPSPRDGLLSRMPSSA